MNDVNGAEAAPPMPNPFPDMVVEYEYLDGFGTVRNETENCKSCEIMAADSGFLTLGFCDVKVGDQGPQKVVTRARAKVLHFEIVNRAELGVLP